MLLYKERDRVIEIKGENIEKILNGQIQDVGGKLTKVRDIKPYLVVSRIWDEKRYLTMRYVYVESITESRNIIIYYLYSTKPGTPRHTFIPFTEFLRIFMNS